MTVLWVPLAFLGGFFLGMTVACVVAANRVRDLEIMHRAACSALAAMDQELRKPPKRVNRMGEMILSDRESDAVWESIFGPSPWEIDQ